MEQLGNAISDSTSESDTIGYIAVVYETNPYVDKSLVYNGQEQTGVYEGSAYTLSGTTKAVNAGTYTATATLKDGYVWTDGDTNKTKTIEWSIAKAKITAKYNNEVVDKAEDATYAVEVTGFVDGENAENAKGYKAPVVEKPQLNDNTHTYKLIPANGEADNYEFEYVEGILNVGLKAVDKPSCDSNKYYDGKDTDFVEANAGYKRTGDYHGKNAGKYSFNVRLNEGYVWSDGTSDDIEFNISIRKRNLKLVYEDVTTEYGVYPTELKFKVADEQIIWQPSGLAEGETLEGLIESGELKYLGISNSSYGWETTDENNDIKCNIEVSDNDFEAVNYDIYNGSPSGIWTQKSIAKTLDNGKTTFNDKKIAEIVEEINNAKDGDTISFYAPVYVDIIPSEILEAATKAWDELNVSNGAQSVTTVTVVRKKFLEEHRQAVEEYLEYAKKSTDYTLENVSQAAEWTEKYETFLNPNIALDAIPQCSICTITGNEMKTILSGFLQIMYELNPDAVGGKMPDDEFYYIPEAEQKLSADSTQQGKEAGTNNSQTTGESQLAGEGITGEQADGTLIADNTGNAENANGSDGSGDSDGLSNTGSTDNSGSLSSAGGTDNSGGLSNAGNSGSAGSSDNSGIAGGNGGSDSGNAYSNGSGNGYAGERGNTSNGQTDNSQQAGQGADTGSGASKSSIEAGTYTVTANIWFRKEDSGLPLNPHITSSIFPPKDPVSDNAQLTVDSDGNCSVRVPVVIQSKVMTIQQLEGFSNTTLMGVERDGSGNITAVTLGLGKLGSVNDTVTDTCVATLQMGDLAMSISGFSRDQIWPAQFQMN